MTKKKILFISILVILFSTGFFSLTRMSNGINNVISTSNLKTSSLDYTNATVISDSVTPWNDQSSQEPKIAIDNKGNVHVVWQDETSGAWGIDTEIMYASNSGSGWTNATVISDSATPWNDGTSIDPEIAVDNKGNVYVVWEDDTNGAWGTDVEIMYASNSGSGWSNATVISDDGTLWNDGGSYNPSIAIDSSNNIHVVWSDNTNGAWGIDTEIMYASNSGSGWTNATVISDSAISWNDQTSADPKIATDNSGTIHVVWEDDTDGAWGGDYEIMYTSNSGSGWTNATVISDDGTLWNDGGSYNPSIAVDTKENVHVVWYDTTDGAWGTDTEIMYSSYNGTSWLKGIVISDLHNGIIWNDGPSFDPSIAIDKTDKIHVVWYDYTPGLWVDDSEIMYSSNSGSEWTLPYVISDDKTNWNNEDSYDLDIAVSTNGKAYVVWEDETNGAWGIDREIMVTSFTAFTPSSGGGISFGYTFIFFMIIGVISIIGYTKKKL